MKAEEIKSFSGSFIPVEAVMEMFSSLSSKIDEIATCKESDGIKWAKMSTIAKRYDMSKSSMERYMGPLVESKKVRVMQANDGVRLSHPLYSVEDADKYLPSIIK